MAQRFSAAITVPLINTRFSNRGRTDDFFRHLFTRPELIITRALALGFRK